MGDIRDESILNWVPFSLSTIKKGIGHHFYFLCFHFFGSFFLSFLFSHDLFNLEYSTFLLHHSFLLFVSLSFFAMRFTTTGVLTLATLAAASNPVDVEKYEAGASTTA